MTIQFKAAVDTVMGLALCACATLYLSILPMSAAAADPASGRTWLLPQVGHGHRLHYVTHDQFIGLAVLAGLFAVCLALSLILEDRRRRTL